MTKRCLRYRVALMTTRSLFCLSRWIFYRASVNKDVGLCIRSLLIAPYRTDIHVGLDSLHRVLDAMYDCKLTRHAVAAPVNSKAFVLGSFERSTRPFDWAQAVLGCQMTLSYLCGPVERLEPHDYFRCRRLLFACTLLLNYKHVNKINSDSVPYGTRLVPYESVNNQCKQRKYMFNQSD